MNKHSRKSLISGQAHADRRNGGYSGIRIVRLGEPTPEFRQCQFIAGEDHHMCGAPALPGKPYCPTHAAICYRPDNGDDAA